MRHLAFVTCVLFAWLVPVSVSAQRIVAETFMIQAADSGIQLHVRNKRLEGRDNFPAERVVLFVHGATYPSETAFDIDLPGGSWMENVARKGYDAYLVDVRGYGRSTRPASMNAPPAENPPFATTAEAIKDVGSAVDFILKRRGISKLNLVGWSWGTAIMAGYTMNNNERVNKLVLYAPLWYLKAPPPFSGSGAYRTASRDAARQRGIRGIPPQRVEEISPSAWFDSWWQGNLATDPAGAKQNPPVIRAPNGVLKDIVDYWGASKATWEPEKIRVPTLLILAEWDQDTPLYMAQEVFARLVNTPYKRHLVLGEGTHTVAVEKNRMHLINQVQNFLDE
ncbi:MAG TPA: alpha/beta fold hydrolase [Methylomirabilota bacterium]|nr:alpha/beta fold hydrolase [Methylomirabilota bacterium]